MVISLIPYWFTKHHGKKFLFTFKPAYHSKFTTDFKGQVVCGCAILPIKTQIKGGGAPVQTSNDEDVIDEVLTYFKANVLFKNYEIKSDADRTLVYLTFYAHLCLKKIAEKKCQDLASADKILFNQAQEKFQIPGEPGFVLGGFFSSPKNSQESVLWTSYFKTARQELGLRLLQKIFPDPKQPPTKYWMQFQKRKFLNKEVTK